MNGKGGGGCCIARYGGGGGGMYGMSKVDRIMQKYRPIAPKPAAAGSGSGSGGSSTENSNGYVKCGRTKRKYVRVNKNKKKKETCSKRKFTPPPAFTEPEVVTLSLLPETPDQKHDSYVSDLASPTTIKCNCSSNINITTTKAKSKPMWLDFNTTEAPRLCLGHKKSVVPVFSKPAASPKVVSYVTIECVTDTWAADMPSLGCTDEERVKNMEHDTCPSFISDGHDRVVWTNEAYRQMAGGDNISVALVRKDNWTPPLPLAFPAFTCKVKVTSNRATTTTLPCDVWRMERGACAWRLDVTAALSLGR